MRLSRILLPMVWPMVAVFALGAAVGVAVPQPEPESVPAATVSPGGADSSATDAPPNDGSKGSKEEETGPGAPDESPSVAIPSESPSISPPPSPSSSPSVAETCTDSEQVVVLAIAAPGATLIVVGDVFEAAAPVESLAPSDDAAQLEATIAGWIRGKTDVVLLVSGTIDLERVAAVGRAAEAKRLWVVVGSEGRNAWSEFATSVFAWDVSKVEKLRSWATSKLPCLFTEES